MYSTGITITTIFYIQQFLLITAYPKGAPSSISVCTYLIPGHLHTQQPIASFPYNVTVHKIVNDEYIPGENYTSKLDASC